MLSLKLLKGHNIDPLDMANMKHSHSCVNLSRATTPQFGLRNSFTCSSPSSFFSIYQRSKIRKAPPFLQLQNKMHQLTKRIKLNREEMVNSIHRHSMRDSLKQKYSDLYLTNFKDSNSNSGISNIDESSSLKIKSDRNYSILPYDSYVKDKLQLNVGMLLHRGKSTYEYIRNLNDVFVLKKCLWTKKEKYLQLREDKQSLISELASYEQRLLSNKKLLTKGYETVFAAYLQFLQSKVLDEKISYDALKGHKHKLLFDINKLKINIFSAKQKINELIDIRNFLIKVKEHTLTIPLFLTEQLKDTCSCSNNDKPQCCGYSNKCNPIFASPQEFMTAFNAFESSNLQLLSEHSQLQHEIQRLKEELQQLKLNVNNKEATLLSETAHKEMALRVITSTNQKLKTQINVLLSSLSMRYVPRNNQINSMHSANTKQEVHNVDGTYTKDNLMILKYKQAQKKYPLYTDEDTQHRWCSKFRPH